MAQLIGVTFGNYALYKNRKRPSVPVKVLQVRKAGSTCTCTCMCSEDAIFALMLSVTPP